MKRITLFILFFLLSLQTFCQTNYSVSQEMKLIRQPNSLSVDATRMVLSEDNASLPMIEIPSDNASFTGKSLLIENPVHKVSKNRAQYRMSKNVMQLNTSTMTYTITVNSHGENGYTKYGSDIIQNASKSYTVEEGSSFSITAHPDEGYRVAYIRTQQSGFIGTTTNYMDNSSLDHSASLYNIKENGTIDVYFEEIPAVPPTYTITVNSHGINGYTTHGSDEIRDGSKSYTVTEGSSFSITAHPDEGYRVANIRTQQSGFISYTTNYMDNSSLDHSASLSRIKEDGTIDVYFEEIPAVPPTYTITVNSHGINGYTTHGSDEIRDGSKSYTVTEGSSFSITAHPDEGYRVANIRTQQSGFISYTTNYMDNSSLDHSASLSRIKEDGTINVYFEKIPARNIIFADNYVKALCVTNWDTDGNGEIDEEEAAAVTDLGTVFKSNTNITSFDELQYFTGLTGIGTYAFSGCTGLTSVTIPNSVTTIGSYAFVSCSSLTSVTIPNSVTNIRDCAFLYCYGLTSLTIGNSVTTIGSSAFYDCEGLPSVTIPNSVTNIGDCAFCYCYGLTSLTIGNNVTTIGRSAFEGCHSLTSVTIGSGIKTIGDEVFANCKNLTEVTCFATNVPLTSDDAFKNSEIENAILYVPTASLDNYRTTSPWSRFGTIKSISWKDDIIFADATVKALCVAKWDTNHDGELSKEEAAAVTYLGTVFKGNTNITSFDELQYFTGLTSIGEYAFQGCSSLTSVTIPNSVTSIGDQAFEECSGLTSVNINDLEAWCKIKFRDYFSNPLNYAHHLMLNGKEIKDLVIPNSVTTIGDYAFLNCSGLTSVTIPNSVTTIGYMAFAGCPLNSVIIPNSVTSVGGCAFSGCRKAIIHCKNIGCNWFGGVSYFDDYYGDIDYDDIDNSLEEVEIGDEVTSIDDGAFVSCKKLTSVTIPNNVTSIGKCAFSHCQKAIIHCKNISKNWFSKGFYSDEWGDRISLGNNTLKEVEIGSEVATIERDAFSGCVALTSVHISDIVAWCNINFNGNESNPLYYAHHLFLDGEEVKDFIIPNNMTSIGNYIFSGCSGLTSVTIPSSVTTIGNSAFSGCSGLTSVVIPSSVTTIRAEAFRGCPLASLTIPNSVIDVGEGAFWGCQKAIIHCKEVGDYWFHISNIVWYDLEGAYRDVCTNCSLKELEIGKEVISVGSRAFTGCDALEKVIFHCKEIGSNWFESWESNCLNYYNYGGPSYYPRNNTALKEIEIGDEVIDIGDYAFNGCTNLTTVTIPNNVTSVGIGAFSSCQKVIFHCNKIGSGWFKCLVWDGDYYYEEINNSLKEIVIGDEVTTIGDYAFNSCTNLTSVTIPNNVTSVGIGAFSGCQKVIFHCNKIGSGWFKCFERNYEYYNSDYYNYEEEINNISLKEIVIGDEVTTIGNYAFSGCTGLTSVSIPNSVTSIAGGAFYGCSGLTSVTIPNSVTTIGNYAFSGCTGLTTVTSLSVYPLVISEQTFPNRANATLYVPAGCKEYYASELYWRDFKEIIELGEILKDGDLFTAIIPILNKTERIPMTFRVSSVSGKTVEVGGGSQAVPISVTGEIRIPERIKDMTVKDIRNNAFADCTGLSYVTIPSSVESIGAEAFSGCTGLKAVKVEGVIPASVSDNSAFPNRADIILCVPKGSKPSYASAYCWKDFKAIKEITDGDVNVDLETDVIDVVDIARFVVGNPAESFVEFLADVNYDDKVNIGDAVALVNEIAGDQHFVKSSTVKLLPEIHEVLSLTEKTDGSLALNLENQRGYTAFQFDIFLPEDVDITEIALNGSRRQQHQLLYSKVGDGHYKVAALSTSNRTFSGSKGELLGFITDSSIHDGILIDDIHFFTPNGQDYLFDAVSLSGTTEIETVAEDKELQDGEHPSLYDMQGRKILSPVGRKGIYIVNGKKVVIK